jgi:hypothetical protein
LDGYSSTSLSENVAASYTRVNLADDMKPVLLEIHMKNETNRLYFSLDSEKYSCYPDEKEILLQAGIMTEIESIK